jgi:hypothetical protein
MSLRDRLVLPRFVLPIIVIVSALAVLVGCSSTPSATPPPSGSFSNKDLDGTYVFSTSGSDSSGNTSFFTMAGTITADGNGGISTGTIDINDSDGGVQSFGQSISASSKYSVGVDGRGKINLVNTALGTITFDFVLNSSSGGLITEFDGNGTGSGTLDAQSAAITQTQLAQGFAFSLSGFDSTETSPLIGAGAFTLGSDGTVTAGTGVSDFNDAQIPRVDQGLSGSVTLGSSGSSGTAQFSTALGVLNFNFYVVDASHLKLIETDPLPSAVLSGDVFLQASIPTGTLAFTMFGDSTSTGPLALGGLMTSSGPGVTTNGLEDYNIGGTLNTTQLPFTLSYTAPVNGRSTLTLTGFAGVGLAAAYPSTGGLLMVSIDSTNSEIASGSAYAVTNPQLGAPPQGYGLNFTGSNSGGFEVDDIAEFTTSASTGPTGLVDENDQGSTQPVQAITNSLSAFSQDSPVTGRGEATFANSNGILFDVIFYTIGDGSNSIFIETDNTQVAVGIFQLQNSGAKAAAATAHRVAVHPLVMPHLSARHRAPAVHPK